MSYAFEMEYDRTVQPDFTDQLRQCGVLNIGHRYFFQFTDEEYEGAPLYRLTAVGNTPAAYLKSFGAQHTYQTLCPACGLRTRRSDSNLTLNTARLGRRDLVSVDAGSVVLSEKLARLLAEWGLTGYQLEAVIHQGPEKGWRAAYELVSTSTMPPWSSSMSFLYPPHLQHRRCAVCGLPGRIPHPFHYDRASVANAADFNTTSEWVVRGAFAVHDLLVSARFRRQILDYGLASDARYAQPPGKRDWTFEPVIITE